MENLDQDGGRFCQYQCSANLMMIPAADQMFEFAAKMMGQVAELRAQLSNDASAIESLSRESDFLKSMIAHLKVSSSI